MQKFKMYRNERSLHLLGENGEEYQIGKFFTRMQAARLQIKEDQGRPVHIGNMQSLAMEKAKQKQERINKGLGEKKP